MAPASTAPPAASAAPRSAPRTRKSAAERRAEVADTARDLALREGLDAVTLRAVAARMGVASGLIAHYAPSMDDLVADTFGDIVEDELVEVLALLPDAPAPARLGAMMRTLLDDARREVNLVWVQSWALGTRNAPLAARVHSSMDAWRAAISAEIARGMHDGTIPRRDPDPLAWHVLAMIDGLSAHSLVGWSPGVDRVGPVVRAVAGLLDVEPGALIA